ncbi:MAG: thymidylate synthase [Bacteroidetes bacterium QS_9_68_14]|nr:MAG: thymidylate synthase [Bacteroidetes bacterium QS_9_68_14]
MRPYLDYLLRIMEEGTDRGDRTGTGTRSRFGAQMRFDLAEGFPLVTTKRVWFRGVAEELLWMLRGGTNIRPLVQHGVSIWTDWPLRRYREETGHAAISQEAFEERVAADADFAEKWGDLGPVYGRQWRAFSGKDGEATDQIARALRLIRQTPESRRIVVSAWNPPQLDAMALPPCHVLFQFYVAPPRDSSGQGRLSCQVYQRSADSFLGVPFNLASYALLTHLMADQTGLAPGRLIWTGGDCHVYRNHFDQARTQLARVPKPRPRLRIERTPEAPSDYRFADFALEGYEHHPALEAPIAV